MNTFSLQQISETGNLDSNLITRQCKLDLMTSYLENKSMNPRLRQDKLAKELVCSSSTLQRCRQDLNVLSLYRIPPNSHRRKQKTSNHENDLATSNDLKRPQLTSKVSCQNIETVKPRKSELKGGANFAINGEYLDEIFLDKIF